MQTFPARGVAIGVVYGGFWLLLLYNATLAIWAAFGLVAGGGAVMLGIYLVGRRY